MLWSVLSQVFASVWVISLIIAQKSVNKYKWTDDVISKYISHSRVLQIGFLFLAQGIYCSGLAYGQTWAYQLGQIGAIGVVLTETIWDNHRIHVMFAGLAYGFTIIGFILSAPTMQLLGSAWTIAALIPITAIVKDEVNDQERVLGLAMVQWIVTAAIIG